ncbi:MAG: hypothetical protein JO272_06305 [Pseudonocardiales bacterium]|nr:hypothetical protein [Pseudonocardiales bacterium]
MESGVRPLSLECAQMADRCLDTGGALTALVRAGYAGQRWHDGRAEPNGGLLIVEVATSEGKIVVPVPRRDVFMALGIGASSMLPDLHRTTVPPKRSANWKRPWKASGSLAGSCRPLSCSMR